MPRIDASEAIDKIKRLRAAIRLQMPIALERGIRAGHEQHLEETKKLQAIFARERYVRFGQIRQLGWITEKWQRRKIALGKPADLGQFTGTLLKAIGHLWSSPRTRTGWRYDIREAGRLIARYRTLGKRLAGGKRGPRKTISRPLRDDEGTYLDNYVSEKAPGLGELPPGSVEREDAAVREATREEFAKIMSGLGFPAVNGIIEVPLSFRVTR